MLALLSGEHNHVVSGFQVSVLLHILLHLQTPFAYLIPAIRWNIDGAFIGTVTNLLPDTGLIFDTFLAAPLLNTSDYVERKFSGSTTAGHSLDVVGSAIDAYAHHVLADSAREFLLTDLQGMSFQNPATQCSDISLMCRCCRSRAVCSSV